MSSSYSRCHERQTHGLEGPQVVGPWRVHEFRINAPLPAAPSLSGIIELSAAGDDERLVDQWIWYGPAVDGGPLGLGKRIGLEQYAPSASLPLIEWIWSRVEHYLKR
jgi:hypothetical protein